MSVCGAERTSQTWAVRKGCLDSLHSYDFGCSKFTLLLQHAIWGFIECWHNQRGIIKVEIIAGLSLLPLSLLYQLLSHCWGEHGQRPLKRNKIVKKVNFIPSSVSFPCGRTCSHVWFFTVSRRFLVSSPISLSLYSALSLKNIIQDPALFLYC